MEQFRCKHCSTDNFGKYVCEGCGAELVKNGHLLEHERTQKKKREESNVIIGIVVCIGGIFIGTMVESVIPAILGFILAGWIYNNNS